MKDKCHKNKNKQRDLWGPSTQTYPVLTMSSVKLADATESVWMPSFNCSFPVCWLTITDSSCVSSAEITQNNRTNTNTGNMAFSAAVWKTPLFTARHKIPQSHDLSAELHPVGCVSNLHISHDHVIISHLNALQLVWFLSRLLTRLKWLRVISSSSGSHVCRWRSLSLTKGSEKYLFISSYTKKLVHLTCITYCLTHQQITN